MIASNFQTIFNIYWQVNVFNTPNELLWYIIFPITFVKICYSTKGLRFIADMVQYVQWVNMFRIIVVRGKIVSWDSCVRGHTMSMIIIMEP